MMRKFNNRGMLKKLMALSLAGAMTLGSAVSVQAATLKDVFDANYYADTYEDLENAFGNDAKALFNHYNTYGQAEGRVMSQLINVVEYRNYYPDLDAAFGDDWDAYVDHYLTYGVQEGRCSFGSFDARAYADRYPDLKEAFGYDVLKLYQHYVNYGREEGRYAGPAYVPSSYSAPSWTGSYSDSTGSTGSVNTDPITIAGRLVDPETGAPVANATIRFTITSFVGLTEVVENEIPEDETPDVTTGDETTDETPEDETPDVTTGDETTVETPGYYEVTTDENGYYEVPNFVPGVYSVEATAPGYLSLTLNTIEINSNAGSYSMPTFELLSSDISGSNTVAGTAVDATTGTGIAGVTLNIRANWNNTTGDVVTSVVTDETGAYSVELARGYYTIEFVSDGYVSNYVNVASSNAVGATGCTLNPSSTISEVQSTEFRIVLTWGETPRDLDSHLVGPSDTEPEGYFHVCYYDKVYSENGENVASLDVDDTSSYGPETVTLVNAAADATYYYSVKNFSNQSATSTTMAASGANVKVYQGSVLVKEYNVPANGVGYIWNVFKIENGQIVDLNGYSGNESTMYGHYRAQ